MGHPRPARRQDRTGLAGGLAAHYANGVILAIVYAALAPSLWGPGWVCAGGERWRVGSVVLQVTSPRVPCWKLGVRMGDPRFPRRFAAAGRPGAYLAILEEGEVGAGDRIQVIHRPEHGVTVGLVAASYHRDHRLAASILAAPELPTAWKHWAEHQTRTDALRRTV